MKPKLTRRQWAGVLAAASGMAAAAAPAAVAAQAPAAAESPAELLAQARQGVERNREALAKFKIPMSLEPVTRFEA